MVSITSKAITNVVCESVHGPSGVMLKTDAPGDMGGAASSFSPTDLVATALLTCIMTTMGIAANKLGVDLSGMQGSVTKEMSTTMPRRIARLIIALQIPAKVTDEQREKLEHAAHHCPVHHTLSAETLKEIQINWA